MILTSQADPKTSEANAPGAAITKPRAVHDWCVMVCREMDSDNISAPCFPLRDLYGVQSVDLRLPDTSILNEVSRRTEEPMRQ
ncbi:MAG: hypothetical protein VYE46_04905 [Cyanobacteriota bacterium]|nr:hypothetical protein [Cyanobacteriota bacterium]